ncbi:MAG: hypothetical protein KAY37_12795 [Phycisphaerae bacterium]|nr:hypothetical protein [Phycisphaerae bacterium]
MRNLILYAAAVGLACGACQKPSPRLNAPPHGVAENTSDLRDTFAHMIDNGLLADMTISDIHFVPHRALLNSLGEDRLCRLAGLIEVYGGVIRFNPTVTDEDLIARRTETVMAFLADEGIDTSRKVLTHDLPGGRGMDATQAILIKKNEATYKPKQQTGLFGKSN